MSPSKSAHIAFRLLDGTTIKHKFPPGSTIIDLYNHIDTHVQGLGNYVLMTTHPRKEYSSESLTLTLDECSLTPNATIILKCTDTASPHDGNQTNYSTRGASQATPAASASSQRSSSGSGSGSSGSGGGGKVRGAAASALKSTKTWLGYLNPVQLLYPLMPSRDPTMQPSSRQRTDPEQHRAEYDDGVVDSSFGSGDAFGSSQDGNGGASVTNRSSATQRRTGGCGVHRLNDYRDDDDRTHTWNGNSTLQE